MGIIGIIVYKISEKIKLTLYTNYVLLVVIDNLLLARVKAALKSPLTITEVSKVVGASLLTKTDLRELLDVPAPLTQNQNVNELELNF